MNSLDSTLTAVPGARVGTRRPFLHRWSARLGAGLLCLQLTAPLPAQQASTGGTGSGGSELRQAMIRIVTDLREVLDLTADGLPQSADRQQALRAAIVRLDDQATVLEEHVGSDDAALMASALAQSSKLLRYTMSHQDTLNFERTLSRTIETCSACHSRKQPQVHASMRRVIAGAEEPGARGVWDERQDLRILREVRLMVATREAQPAVERLEVMLLSEAPGLDEEQRRQRLNGELYLEALKLHAAVTLLNLDQPVRLQAALERIQQRFEPQSPRHRLLGAWIADLEDYLQSPTRLLQRDTAQAGLHLTAAQDLVDRAAAAPDGEPEQSRIKYLLATRHAQIVHDDPSITRGSFARASYLLGLLEHRLNPSSWLPLRELYLEQAILEAPHSELAEDAFALLQRSLEGAFDGNERAPEVEEHLERLEKLARRP
ncbi:MAG: hypothetical protein KDK91_00740 [Gammaproteobacteria bacterium]|nr:hypothetical protein [Gammaproteobacteria bacterium]